AHRGARGDQQQAQAVGGEPGAARAAPVAAAQGVDAGAGHGEPCRRVVVLGGGRPSDRTERGGGGAHRTSPGVSWLPSQDAAPTTFPTIPVAVRVLSPSGEEP